MKKIFIMVCAAIALVSCGGKTAPSAADVVSDTTEDVTAVAAKTANEAADKAVEAVTTALDEQLKAGDAKTLAKTLASAKAAVEKLQSEGKTEEAAAYASKIKEYVDKNKEALTTAAKGDMTVADLVNGIANLPASVQQGAAAAKAAVNADAAKVASDADVAGKAAKQAAVESAILLKNEKETLPLQSSVKTVAVVGPMANAPYDQLGTWIFDGDKTKTVTPLKAIKELVGDKVQVIYEPGLTYSRDKNMAGVAKAAAAAARADVILAFVGEEAILSGEAHCLADLNLQGAQSELIAALAKTGKPVVTVVMAGRPLTIGKEVELSSAVLYSFHPGTMGGPALADLLWGKAVPSGKTPVTFPKMVGQIPVYYAHNSSGRPATRNEVLLNDIPLEAGQTSLGCTSFYMDAGFDPLYPFGYGLSYTTFKYDNVKLSSANLKKEDVLTVTFDLENTGKYEGTEVAQLYVQDKFASVTRPVKELKRFARVTLKPGEKKNVSFELPISELAFWNIDMVKTVEAGDFALWVAPDSQSGEEVFFKVVD